MSFLGWIGHLMNASGLRELIYASNAVIHILSGAAIARATRAHILVTTALHTMLMEDIFKVTILIDLENGIEELNDNAM
jgi:hypothetical protein